MGWRDPMRPQLLPPRSNCEHGHYFCDVAIRFDMARLRAVLRRATELSGCSDGAAKPNASLAKAAAEPSLLVRGVPTTRMSAG